MVNKILVKPFINKRTKQMSVIIPKRKLKKLNSTIKFDKDLLISLEIFDKKRKKSL